MQAWMFAKLFNEHPAYRTHEILDASRSGIEFLRAHVHRDTDHRVYFCVSEDGKVGRNHVHLIDIR
jgi:mannose/cellobiose epimerase-like protein (N-acyl-D-glucosamine 2-epimerase family)